MVVPPFRRSPSEADAELEAVTLTTVIERHPSLLSGDELCQEVAEDPTNLVEQDAVRNAIRELVRAGLLQRSGEIVLPTRAAIKFKELFGVIA